MESPRSPETGAPTPRLARLAGRTSFAGNVAANYLGRAWEAAMSVAFVPLYIRYLGTEAYGIIGVVAVIQSFMLVLDFGMTPTLTREAARQQAGERSAAFLKDLIRSVEWVVAAVCLTIVALVALAAPFIAERWVHPQALTPATIAQALSVGGALIAMRFFESVFRGTLYGLQRQALCNGIAAAIATLRGGGAVAVIALTDTGLAGFFAWQAAATLLGVAAMRAAVALALPRDGHRARFSREALRSIGRFALGMVAISVLSLAATQADKLVLSRLLPLTEFGYYVFAANLALVLEMAAAPIMLALYPRVVALFAERDDGALAAFFHRWARVVTVLTAPAAAWLVFFAAPLIHAWSGDAVLAERSGALLSILAIGTFLHGQCVLPYYFQLATGWTGLSIWTNALALVVTAISLTLLVPLYGAQAGAWTWVAVASLYFFAALQVMFGRLLPGERWRFYVVDVGLPATAAFVSMGFCARLFPVTGAPLWARLIWLGLAGVLAFTAAAGVAWVVGRRDAQSASGGSGLASIASNTLR